MRPTCGNLKHDGYLKVLPLENRVLFRFVDHRLLREVTEAENAASPPFALPINSAGQWAGAKDLKLYPKNPQDERFMLRVCHKQSMLNSAGQSH
jgi:hypothetical protein